LKPAGSVSRALRILAAAAVLPFGAGCVERTMLIRTEPPGAEVLVDARRVGRTPVEVPFTYGGTHEILVYREGELLPDGTKRYFRPQVVYLDTESAAFDGPLLDLFVDLAPAPFHDRHELEIQLAQSDAIQRYRVAPDAYLDALRERADVVRRRARDAQLDARPLSEPEEAAPDSRPESR
jgi:hypothetical protein